MTTLPDDLLRSLDGLPGFNRGAFVAVHESGRQVTSIRMNPGKQKYTNADVVGAGAFAGGVDRVPWSSWGYYLGERPSFSRGRLLCSGGVGDVPGAGDAADAGPDAAIAGT